ncbi:hypothetical protein MRX96_046181 [Rhipicephalus microplus]
MNMTRLWDRKNITYKLKYWNDTEKCFILQFNVDGNEHCEIDTLDMLPNNSDKVISCEQKIPGVCGNKTSWEKYYGTNCTN